MKIIEKKVSELGEVSVRLLQEIAVVRRTDLDAFNDRMVLHCFQGLLYANGAAEPPIPLTKAECDSSELAHPTLLGTRVGKIVDPELSQIFCELAGLHLRTGTECFFGTAVYSFLNKALLRKVPRKKTKLWL